MIDEKWPYRNIEEEWSKCLLVKLLDGTMIESVACTSKILEVEMNLQTGEFSLDESLIGSLSINRNLKGYVYLAKIVGLGVWYSNHIVALKKSQVFCLPVVA